MLIKKGTKTKHVDMIRLATAELFLFFADFFMWWFIFQIFPDSCSTLNGITSARAVWQ